MRQEEKSRITRQRILDAAMEEFGTSGYAGGTMNGICRSGINKGLVYHHFSGKEELYLQCLKISCSDLLDFIRKEHADGDLQSYMSARTQFFRKNPKESRIFFEALMEPPAGMEKQIGEILEPFRAQTQMLCRRTLQGKVLRSGVSEKKALEYIAVMQEMFNGYFSSPRCRCMSWEEKVQLHEKMVPGMLDLLLYGIAKEP